jgi:hypothetical protein
MLVRDERSRKLRSSASLSMPAYRNVNPANSRRGSKADAAIDPSGEPEPLPSRPGRTAGAD